MSQVPKMQAAAGSAHSSNGLLPRQHGSPNPPQAPQTFGVPPPPQVSGAGHEPRSSGRQRNASPSRPYMRLRRGTSGSGRAEECRAGWRGGTSEFGRSVHFCASPEKGLYFGYLPAIC